MTMTATQLAAKFRKLRTQARMTHEFEDVIARHLDQRRRLVYLSEGTLSGLAIPVRWARSLPQKLFTSIRGVHLQPHCLPVDGFVAC